MLADLPFDVQVHIFGYLDHPNLYQGCLVARSLNEAASRVLYMEVVWNGGCCERQRNKAFMLEAAFHRRPHLIPSVREITLLAGASCYIFPSPMANLRRLTFAPCGKCGREWEDASVMLFIRHFYDPSAPKTVSVHGRILLAQDTEDRVRSLEFTESRTLIEGDHFWPWMRQGTLLHLDMAASDSALLNSDWNLNHLRTLNVQDVGCMGPLLAAIKDMHSLSELTMECTAWSRTLTSEAKRENITCNLPSLTTIHLQAGQHFIGESAFEGLCTLFECITPLSFALENIHLGATPPRLNPPFPGDLLIRGIIDRNKQTLRLLDVSAASVSADVISQLMTECPQLQELNLSSSRSDLYTMSAFLPQAATLRDLHLSLDLPVDLVDPHPAIEELFALPSSLRQLNVYIPTVCDWGDDLVWMRTWEYDPDRGVAVLVNTGPWMVVTWTQHLTLQYKTHQDMLTETET